MTQFTQGRIYQHSCGKDLDIRIVKVSYENCFYTKLRILYVSKNTGSVLSNNPENIKILREDYKYWSAV